jgi:choline-sulfatase
MKPKNILFILSDEHNKKVLGSNGNSLAITPNLDRLSASGTVFDAAYTACPICVPARASLATGRYVNEIGCWDNAIAYEGEPSSWGHHLMSRGHRVSSIGKLHYKQCQPSVNGFSEEILPLHIADGIGDLMGLIRDEIHPRNGAQMLGPEAGPGESEYTRYDRDITESALAWIAQAAHRRDDKPWVLYVGYVAPHFPLIAPTEFFDLYRDTDFPLPLLYRKDQRPNHPFLAAMREVLVHDKGFTDDRMVRRALQAYYGLVSFLDANIGRLLDGLRKTGLADDTIVIYSSDHGDNLGARGLWAKSTMYEDSAGVPLIIAGPSIAAGRRISAPVSLIDIFPTLVEGVGADLPPELGLSGVSLLNPDPEQLAGRTVLSEYHAAGGMAASYMVRHGNYKYIHYVGMPPMLFDLENDPQELIDLGQSPGHETVRGECEFRLRQLLDPEQVDARARRDQQARITAAGGKDAILKRGTFRFSPTAVVAQ